MGRSALTWAGYLNAFHNKVHPIFAQEYFDGLCARGLRDPLNDPSLVTKVEIAFARDGGVEVVLVEASGRREFDLAVIESVLRVGVMPPPDPALLSDDGRAYVQWEFRRDEVFACSTMLARPYLLTFAKPADAAP